MKPWYIFPIVGMLLMEAAPGQVPSKISYQGLLTTSPGIPVTDGQYKLTFRIWDDSAGGSAQWTETLASVSVDGGSFGVILGSTTSLVNFNFNRELYVEVTVDSGPSGPSYPLPPFARSQLTSAPSALGPWVINGNDATYTTGNIGIGTASPTAKLHIGGIGGVDGVRFPDGSLQTTAASGPGSGWTDDGSVVRLVTGTDKVGIGATTPSERLEVAGTIYSTSGGFKFPNGTVQTSAAVPGLTGGGTTNFIPKFAGGTILGNSILYEGLGAIGINTTTPSYPLEIAQEGIQISAVGITTASNSLSWPLTRFNRARGTLSSKTAVTSGDGLGAVDFYGFDGTFFSGAASIQAYVSGSPLSGDIGGQLWFRTNEEGGSVGTKVRMVITDNGRVGIGTLGPSNVLSVVGNVDVSGFVGIGTTSPSNAITLANVAGPSGQGLANAWTTYSSRRWKTHIREFKHAIEEIKRLRGVRFDWKADGRHDIGLIAEEVGQVIPEVVQFEQNGEDAKSVDYSRLVALLIEGMKEQQSEIEELKGLLRSLTNDHHPVRTASARESK